MSKILTSNRVNYYNRSSGEQIDPQGNEDLSLGSAISSFTKKEPVKHKEFDILVRIFRKEFSDFKFRIRRLNLKSAYGTCEKKADVFFISIHKDLNEDLSIHILVHELAHMLVWDEPGDIHNEKWGKAYSRVYRIFVNKYVNQTT